MQLKTVHSRVASAIEDHARYLDLLKQEHQDKVTRLEGEIKGRMKIHELAVESHKILLEKSDAKHGELQNEVETVYREITSRNEVAMNVVSTFFSKLCS